MVRRAGPDAPKTWEDLARVTGLSEKSVKLAIRTGDLPGYKVGKLYIVPAEAFDRFCAGDWQPQPRPLFPEPIKPLPQPSDFLRRKGA